MDANVVESNVVVEEICRWGLSSKCIRYGDKRLFKGRCCPPCTNEKVRRYYIDNKEVMKQRSKQRSKECTQRRKEMVRRQKEEELNALKALDNSSSSSQN